MKQSKFLNLIPEIVIVLLFFATGIITLVFSNVSYSHQFLGYMLIAFSSCKLARFILENGFKRHSYLPLITTILGISLGMFFIFGELSVKEYCLIWGIYEVTTSCVEVAFGIKEAKEDLFAIGDAVTSVGEVVFGVLLCIHMDAGIYVHLLFTGIDFLVLGAILLVRTFVHGLKK